MKIHFKNKYNLQLKFEGCTGGGDFINGYNNTIRDLIKNKYNVVLNNEIRDWIKKAQNKI